MGNCISFSLDNLLICCFDRAKGDVMYIWEFKGNLKNLKDSLDELRASKNDVKQRVENQEGPQTKRLQVVDQWLKSVEDNLAEADELISRGEDDIAKKSSCLGRGGCCCYNFYSLGKSLIDTKEELDLLMQRGRQFDKLVEEVLEEPKYISQIKKDVKDLEAAKNGLEARKKDVMRRVTNQEGGKMKRLERVQAWMLQVEKLVIGVDELLRNVAEELIYDPRFGKRVSDTLEDVRRLRSEGDFRVVVEAAESEYLSRIQDNIESLRTAVRSLSGLKDNVMQVRSEEEILQKKRLKQVEAWRKNAEATIAAADRMLNVEAPVEMKKLNLGDSSNHIGERLEKMLKDVVDQTKKGHFTVVTATALPEPVIEIECDQTVGLQTKLDDVWSLLMNPEVGILGLYGLRGVGKTTLLTHINNKFIGTQNDFDFVIWILREN